MLFIRRSTCYLTSLQWWGAQGCHEEGSHCAGERTNSTQEGRTRITILIRHLQPPGQYY